MNEIVLVTGGTGFVASHCIFQLLQKGYRVKTTLRNLNRSSEVQDRMRYGGINPIETLEFVETDLTRDANWDEAVKNCDYVLHIASPIGLSAPKDENEFIRTAVDGTLRVLQAARKAGVRRVVMTSNFGAVGYSHKDTTTIITEEEWTDPDEKGLSAYNKSKVLAERAAWDFIRKEDGNLELTTINPMAIFGPSLGPHPSSGFELLKQVLDGSMKSIPNISLGIVDVRDLADLHIRAMTNPAANGQRFLSLSGGTMTLPEIAKLFKERLGDQAKNVSTRSLPDWIVRLLALIHPSARNLIPLLGKYRNASNQKAKTLLDWHPRTNEEAVLATAESLIKFGHIS